MKLRGIALTAGLLAQAATGHGQAVPLLRAHAHNDYEHARPLLDALDRGFCSVEADVWLLEGELRVAHDLRDARPGRTLQKLYLDPLRERVRANGGRVYRDGPAMTLLVDVKSEATNTYAAIRHALQPYRSMLTVFRRDRTETNAVTVIVSGNRARGLMASEPERLAAFDGRLADLEGDPSRHFMPWISDNWRLHFRWRGAVEDGPLSGGEMERLRSIVQRAHARGLRVRFWGMPDSPHVWRTLVEADVDLINTDQLDGLARFLTGR